MQPAMALLVGRVGVEIGAARESNHMDFVRRVERPGDVRPAIRSQAQQELAAILREEWQHVVLELNEHGLVPCANVNQLSHVMHADHGCGLTSRILPFAWAVRREPVTSKSHAITTASSDNVSVHPGAPPPS